MCRAPEGGWLRMPLLPGVAGGDREVGGPLDELVSGVARAQLGEPQTGVSPSPGCCRDRGDQQEVRRYQSRHPTAPVSSRSRTAAWFRRTERQARDQHYLVLPAGLLLRRRLQGFRSKQAHTVDLADQRGVHARQCVCGGDAVGGREFRGLYLGRVEVDLGWVGDRVGPVAE